MTSVFVRTIIVYIVLNIMLKIMGKRQIGELEVNELVCTLLISEIASIPISDPDAPLLSALIPITFICALEIAVSAIKNKSSRLKKLVEGDPVYIIYKGRLRQNVLKDNRISINEILTEMRIQNIGDICDIYYGILEQNGKISLFKTEDKNSTAHTLVIDGEIDERNLGELKLSKEWVNARLGERHLSVREVFLMTITDDERINIIEKEE